MFHHESPFADLPAALIQEVLDQTSPVAAELLEAFRQVGNAGEKYRRTLVDRQLVVTESSLGYSPVPTTCAADGSYAIERLLMVDMTAAAAVAVEGLTPPSEVRHWDGPHHKTFVAAEPHREDTATVLRAVMLGEELVLLHRAPHELLLLDGTLTLPLIYFNQALNALPSALESLRCAREFVNRCIDYFEAYGAMLYSARSNQHYAALPKYSTRREIGRVIGWPGTYDDRSMLTLLLQPGELTRPQSLEHPLDAMGQPAWHLNIEPLPPPIRQQAEMLKNDILAALQNIRVFYYKPHSWLPALRIEVTAAIADNPYRLAAVLQGVKQQCVTASMLEPYPLYHADRTVKALARAIPAFRQVTMQKISERYEGDFNQIFLSLHGYRSEMGN